MYLHEAVKQSLETGKYFRRKSTPNVFYGVGTCEIGSVTIYCLHKGFVSNFWNPMHDDLLSDDWEVGTADDWRQHYVGNSRICGNKYGYSAKQC